MLQTVAAVVSLTRPGATTLAFLAVFLPLAARTHNASHSLISALPVLFIAACTFILNDIDDIEPDKVNHPERPLPSGRLLPRVATASYFASLVLALFTIKLFVLGRVTFLYYGLLTLAISYKYAALYFAAFKAVYVAVTSTFPVLIVIGHLHAPKLLLVALATFLFILGRELILDFLDRAGDPTSYIQYMDRSSLTFLALFLHAVAFVALTLLMGSILDMVVMCLLVSLSQLAFFFWSIRPETGRAAFVMKIQLYCGLYFLLC